MIKVKVISKQPDMKIKHEGKPYFKYTFSTEPILMPIEHARILVAQNSYNFKIVTDSEIEIDKSMDLNHDGVIDKKDSSIAGKVLANARKKKKGVD